MFHFCFLAVEIAFWVIPASREEWQELLGGLPKDDRDAARLYKLAADQGNALGQLNLGLFYESGRGGLEKDEREAARLYRLAADQGNAPRANQSWSSV
jgi:TPR repeat protein